MPNLFGTKWGDSTLGTAGGTITWSLAPAGSDVSAFGVGDVDSVSGDSAFFCDFREAISQAFSDWSRFGNIEFIQTEDPGGAAGATGEVDIRIFFGQIPGDAIGFGFFPEQ